MLETHSLLTCSQRQPPFHFELRLQLFRSWPSYFEAPQEFIPKLFRLFPHKKPEFENAPTLSPAERKKHSGMLEVANLWWGLLNCPKS